MQGLPFPIITYQVITGNYSFADISFGFNLIITYQVITGNYSKSLTSCLIWTIITYQVITGNYSINRCSNFLCFIITYQVITENYTPGLGLTGKAAKSTPFLCNHFAPHFAIKSLGSSPNNPITTQSEPFGFS